MRLLRDDVKRRTRGAMTWMPVAVIVASTLMRPVVAQAQSNIDEEVSWRVDALEEILERLEFDADRVGNPPDHAVARSAFMGRICAGADQMSDIVANWTPDYWLNAKNEENHYDWITGNSTNFEVGQVISARLDTMLGFGHMFTKRWCIDVAPFLVAFHYVVRHGSGFETDVPKEVFRTASTPLAYDMRAEFADRALAQQVVSGLSDDSLAFLAVAADLFLGDLDQAGSNPMQYVEQTLAQLAARGDIGVRRTVEAGTVVGDAIDTLANASWDSPFGAEAALATVFAQLDDAVPFMPSFGWLLDRAADPGAFIFDPCSGQAGAPIASLPLFQDALEHYCALQGGFLHLTGWWVETARTYVTGGMVNGQAHWGLDKVLPALIDGRDVFSEASSALAQLSARIQTGLRNAVELIEERLRIFKAAMDDWLSAF